MLISEFSCKHIGDMQLFEELHIVYDELVSTDNLIFLHYHKKCDEEIHFIINSIPKERWHDTIKLNQVFSEATRIALEWEIPDVCHEFIQEVLDMINESLEDEE
ncbi:MAG: hypothetical protein LBR15_03785 [Methanobrevibacter sp.]|jgi:hypothetical protein|nr:hypothetical protein [Candidatus Methanovirga australis]